MKIVANSVRIEDDGYCTVLACAEDPDDLQKYAILQFTNNPTKQDLKLKQSGVHFALGGYDLNGYGLIKAVELVGDELTLSLDESAAKKASVDITLVIKLKSLSFDGMTAMQVAEMFQRRLLSA